MIFTHDKHRMIYSSNNVLTSFLYMQEHHDVVSIDIKLEGVISENIVVTQAALDALKLEGRMDRQQAVPVELDGHGRQTRANRTDRRQQALGHPDGLLDLAVSQGAHMIWAEVAQVDDSAERQQQAYPDDATQACPARPRLHRRRPPLVA